MTWAGAQAWVGAQPWGDHSGLLPPSGLSVTVASATQLNLSWNAVPSATGYDIERDTAVIVTGHPSTNYSDTGLTAGTTYSYRVRSRQQP